MMTKRPSIVLSTLLAINACIVAQIVIEAAFPGALGWLGVLVMALVFGGVIDWWIHRRAKT